MRNINILKKTAFKGHSIPFHFIVLIKNVMGNKQQGLNNEITKI